MQRFGGASSKLTVEEIEKKYGNPPPVPAAMNHVTIHYSEEDTNIKIGDWDCDLMKRRFFKGSLYLDSPTMSYSSPTSYEGEFFFESGKWKARYWKVDDTIPELTVEQAQKALIAMMKETDLPKWGGRRKEGMGAQRSGFTDFDLPEYVDNPPPVPEIMNEIEHLEHGRVRIGFWECDLEARDFFTKCSPITDDVPYEGSFRYKGDGEWDADCFVDKREVYCEE